jgi:hypothetical protein
VSEVECLALGLMPSKENAPTRRGGACELIGISTHMPCQLDHAPSQGEASANCTWDSRQDKTCFRYVC